MTRGGFYVYHPAAWLAIRGEDASEFLQGQFTADLRLQAAHSCTYGLWLDRKGKVQGDSFVLRSGANDFRIFSYECRSVDLCERLERFIIADDVELSDESGSVGGISLIGEAAVGWLAGRAGRAGRPEAGVYLEGDSGVIFRGRRTTGPHLEWVVPREEVPGVVARLRDEGLDELEIVGMERERLRSRLPAVPREIGPDELPQEGGLEREAVSFSKGCYLGQEVMARLRSMGRVRRGLLPVRVRAAPQVPAALFEGSRPVGELRTVLPAEGDGPNGVALVRRDRVGQGFSLEPDGAVVVEAVAEEWEVGS